MWSTATQRHITIIVLLTIFTIYYYYYYYYYHYHYYYYCYYYYYYYDSCKTRMHVIPVYTGQTWGVERNPGAHMGKDLF